MMMRTVRNLTFVGLLATVHLTGNGGFVVGGAAAVVNASEVSAVSSAIDCDPEYIDTVNSDQPPYWWIDQYRMECDCYDSWTVAIQFCESFTPTLMMVEHYCASGGEVYFGCTLPWVD